MIEALQAATGSDVSRETFEKVQAYLELLEAERQLQNLVSTNSASQLWQRHLLDSAQLVRYGREPSLRWIDVGSGAGLPGILLSILLDCQVSLVEPRRLRADFLTRAVTDLRLGNAEVVCGKVERVGGRYDRITARAVAALPKLLGITAHLSHRETLWVLPKGRSAQSELADARQSWHYEVRAEPSFTDAEASILLISNVRAKSRP